MRWAEECTDEAGVLMVKLAEAEARLAEAKRIKVNVSESDEE